MQDLKHLYVCKMFYEEGNTSNAFVSAQGYTQCILVYFVCLQENTTGHF